MLSGLALYFILSYALLTPPDVAIMLSVVLSILIFGLSNYYRSGDEHEKVSVEIGPNYSTHPSHTILARSHFISERRGLWSQTGILSEKIRCDRIKNLGLVVVYITFLLIIVILGPVSYSNQELFTSWVLLLNNPATITQLVAAVMLCFFIPGYTLLLMANLDQSNNVISKLLLSFLFSVLITGLTEYVSIAIVGLPSTDVNNVIILVYSIVLVLFVMNAKREKLLPTDSNILKSFFFIRDQISNSLRRRTTVSYILVFGSISALACLFTYYIDAGVLVGDQWFHHGQAIIINSGTYDDVAGSIAYFPYPPFFSSVLAAFFNLSGLPSANAYASIHFLNIMPVIAFYYFFSKWVPYHQRRAALLASVLFMLSSGFGWIYMLYLSADNPDGSQVSSLLNLRLSSWYTSDIRWPTTFINVEHPTYSNPLTVIGLTAGLAMLGLIKDDSKRDKFRFLAIITAISTLGILSHEEYYIFVIAACVLTLIFKLPNRNLIFSSFLVSILLTLLFNFASPLKYYTLTEIFGVPLIELSLLFVSLAWIVNLIGGLLHKHIRLKVIRRRSLKIPGYFTKPLLIVVLVSLVIYLYSLSFLVWNQLSVADIRLQTGSSRQEDIPWYLYPMKLGLTGLLALTFILSYFFRKFEKQVFVFGIIAVIALFMGPYYDEHRFSKYVMMGMAGFASLLIYNILAPNRSIFLKPLVYSSIIGLVITASSLSTFMFAAYKAIAYENPESKVDFYRRTKINFPSGSEFNLINFFRSEGENLKKSYIAFQGNETDSLRLAYLLDSFSAFPSDKYLENTLDLNASSPAEFYRSLNHSSIKYLVFSQGDISRQAAFSPGISFALKSFPRAYQDNNYLVLEVPDLHISQTTSPEKDIGLIYKKNQLSPSSAISNQTLLDYSDKFFDRLTSNSSDYAINGDKTKIRLSPDPDRSGITLWTRPIQNKNINYIETNLRLTAENKTNNDFGIKWKDDSNNDFYVSFGDDSLSLKRRSPDGKEQLLHTNQEVVGERGLWHNVKIVFLNQSIRVYIDDTLRADASKDQLNGYPANLSQIGLRAYKDMAEFGPLIIGQWQRESSNDRAIEPSNYYPYYVTSGLGLSKLGYDEFIDSDFSVFAKKKIIMTFDPPRHSEGEIGKYLDFVKSGGTLIVMNLDKYNDFSGIFSSLLSIHNGSRVGFDALTNAVKGKSNGAEVSDGKQEIQERQYINISGETPSIEFTNSSDLSVLSFYANKNQAVAPFAIEKSLGQGKIIFVNIIGYFEALNRSPEQFFFSLSNISNLIGLGSDSEHIDTKGHNIMYSDFRNNNSRNEGTVLDEKILGSIELSGNTILRSPSVFIPSDESISSIYVRNMSIITQSTQRDGSFTDDITDPAPKSDRERLNNIKIKDLVLYGQYQAVISTNGSVSLPTMSSHGKYVGISLPTRFNMSVNLSNNAYAQFNIEGNDPDDQQPVKITNGSIYLGIVSNSPDLKSTSAVMRSPEVQTKGRIGFEEFGKSKTETEDGILETKIDHVDQYYDRNGNETRTQFITFLNDIQIEGNIVSDDDQSNIQLLVPGDISERAKSSGVFIPLQKVIFSVPSVILMISVAIVAGIGAYYWSHTRKEKRNLI